MNISSPYKIYKGAMNTAFNTSLVIRRTGPKGAPKDENVRI